MAVGKDTGCCKVMPIYRTEDGVLAPEVSRLLRRKSATMSVSRAKMRGSRFGHGQMRDSVQKPRKV